MKSFRFIPVMGLALICLVACTDRKAEAEMKQRDAEAKARAEASRKEMDQLPKTFQTPDYFKKNEPQKPAESPPPKKQP